MYLKHALVLNSGSIRDLELDLPFYNNGNPKPVILVGPNGAGKTNFLSLVADALVEMAAKAFTDVVRQRPGGGHQYFRLLGGMNSRVGSNFELAALKFGDTQQHFHFASKVGDVDSDQIKDRLSWWSEPMGWISQDHGKQVYADEKQIERSFRDECHVFFPSNRWEKPYWSVENGGNDETTFTDRLEGILGKSLLVTSALSDMKPWLVDVAFDQMIDPVDVVSASNDKMQLLALVAKRQKTALFIFNHLLAAILQIPEARLVRGGRTAGKRKLQVFNGNEPLLPSLESLSAGQGSLLAIFSTILRYTDRGEAVSSTNGLRGIVLIDEIDLHLHANLQYDILPALMAMFPKIQFIVTTHSPLFPLGMERQFGEDGVHILEMPVGRRITAERFGEFRAAVEVLKATQEFEEEVANRLKEQNRSLVFFEGETDVRYMKTAAELLDYGKLTTDVEWAKVDGMVKGGGKDQLKKMKQMLQNNPSLLTTDTLLLFDCDVDVKPLDEGRLHIRVLPCNRANKQCDRGIENLLPDDVFEDTFFNTKKHRHGANVTTTKELDKTKLCEHLCVTKRCLSDFEGFRAVLDEISAVFRI